MNEPQPGIRIDKWLWHARFFKTRTLAAREVSAGHVRVNAVRVSKPAHVVRIGDGLTFPQGKHIRVVRIAALGLRRGPAAEAQALYQDLAPPQTAAITEPEAPVAARKGRPTKKERRKLDDFRGDGS